MSHEMDRLVGPGSPFELEETLRNGRPARSFRFAPRSLVNLYRRSERLGDRTFLIDGDRRFSYGEVLGRSETFAGFLKARGVQASPVAIMLENSAEWVIAFIAVTAAGGTAVLIDPGRKRADIERLLRLTGAQAMVTGAHSAGAEGFGLETLPIDARSEEHVRAAQDPPPLSGPEIDPRQPAMVSFTSGTSGAPKGVSISHAALLDGMMNMVLSGAVNRLRNGTAAGSPSMPNSPCTLVRQSFAYIGGYGPLLLMMYLGGRIVIGRDPAPSLPDIVLRHEVTSISGLSVDCVAALHSGNADPSAFASVRTLNFYGAALGDVLLARVRRIFPNATVGTGYGLTETCGSISTIQGAELDDDLGCSGIVLPSVELRIDSLDTGAPLERGSAGRIKVRGGFLAERYLTASGPVELFDAEGWFDTGDVGWLDDQNRLFVVDRAAHILDQDGALVSCREVEAFVERELTVPEAACVMTSSTGGQARAMVFIGGSVADDRRICALADAISRRFGLRCDGVHTLPSLPKNLSGKIDRRALLDLRPV